MGDFQPSAGSFFLEKNVLVTGATGLVGSWLIKELINLGSSVVAVAKSETISPGSVLGSERENFSFVSGDIANLVLIESIVCDYKVDLVFHLASINLNYGNAYSPYEIFETNIKGTYNVLESIRKYGKKQTQVLVMSSREVEANKRVNSNKAESTRTYLPYEVSKISADLICSSYRTIYNIKVAVLMSSNIYGGGDFNWNRIVPGTIKSVLTGQRPVIRSDGSLIRNYIHVLDVVSALLFVAEYRGSSDNLSIFNIRDRDILSTISLVEKILRICGRQDSQLLFNTNVTAEKQITHEKRIGEINKFGWAPKFSLEVGLDETVRWYENYFKFN